MRTIVTCAAILACAACQPKASESAAKPDKAAETQAIDTAEQSQIAAIAAHDAAGATAVYSDDAVFIDEKGAVSRGRDAIDGTFKQFMADPTLKLDYHPGAKTLSSSGDMAYSTAEFTETYTDPKTKQSVTLKGTNLSVWHKQADGSWKLVADSNPAASSPATPGG